MTAQWIDSGEPIPSVLLETAPVPYREWRIGRFEFRRSRSQGRWSCQTADSSLPICGVAGSRTPVAAFLTVLRMLRTS